MPYTTGVLPQTVTTCSSSKKPIHCFACKQYVPCEFWHAIKEHGIPPTWLIKQVKGGYEEWCNHLQYHAGSLADQFIDIARENFRYKHMDIREGEPNPLHTFNNQDAVIRYDDFATTQITGTIPSLSNIPSEGSQLTESGLQQAYVINLEGESPTTNLPRPAPGDPMTATEHQMLREAERRQAEREDDERHRHMAQRDLNRVYQEAATRARENNGREDRESENLDEDLRNLYRSQGIPRPQIRPATSARPRRLRNRINQLAEAIYRP